MNLVDQGSYITLIINDILKSILFGAVLAILVLFLFLKNWRPTLIVGVSIPLSVLLTLVLMYFSGLTLNMITLSGLALGIGMLVDNSIVVMENIIRLRTAGLSPTRAALQGTKQVVGAIVSSTLTIICVFLPMVFSTGLIRQLLVPMGITITYCLTASLLIAVTVVPASASALLQRYAFRENPESPFGKVKKRYAVWLHWCLNHRTATILVAVVLLAFCIGEVFRTGVTVLPEMVGNSIQVEVQTRDGLTKEESHAQADAALAAIQSVPGVENAGMMDAGSVLSVASSVSVQTDQYGSYICYVTASENASGKEIKQICSDINAAAASLPCEVKASTNVMSDYGSMIASGLTIHVYGPDTDTIRQAASQVAEVVRQNPGFEDVSAGEQDEQKTLHLIIDKDKAMSYGLTVAQIYAQIAERLQTDVTSTTLRLDGENVDVVIRANAGRIVTRENLMDMEFSSSSLLSASSASASADSSVSASALTGAASESTPLAGSGNDTETHKLSEFATLEETVSPSTLLRSNLRQFTDVTATAKDGYNTELLTRELEPQLNAIADALPEGCSFEISGESSQVQDMLHQMLLMIALAVLLIYLVMVAQFQSLLSPFIILLTLPLAFTGGVLALLVSGEQITALALMGFLILLGTIVNNGIVANSITTDFSMKGEKLYLNKLKGSAFDGKFNGDIVYNMSNTKTNVEFKGENMNAEKAIEGAAGIKGALTGTLSFDTKMDFSKKIEVVKGEPPSPLDVPDGCPFRDRCGSEGNREYFYEILKMFMGECLEYIDILPLVDQYLNPIFASFDLLTKAVYTNLVEFGTLHKEQIMQIIKEWEEYKLL